MSVHVEALGPTVEQSRADHQQAMNVDLARAVTSKLPGIVRLS